MHCFHLNKRKVYHCEDKVGALSVQNRVTVNIHWFRRQSSEKAEFTVFKDDDLEMR